MLRKRRNPEKREVRRELVEAFKQLKNLEKILWMLYNPLGYCEECTSTWENGDCTCRGCENSALINEPCDNFNVCICDYLNDAYNIRIHFWRELRANELTELEKDYYENISVKDNYNDEIIRSIIFLDEEAIQKVVDGLTFDYTDYLKIAPRLAKLINVKNEDEAIELGKLIFEMIENYLSIRDEFSICDIVMTDLISISTECPGYDKIKKYPKYQKYLLNKATGILNA